MASFSVPSSKTPSSFAVHAKKQNTKQGQNSFVHFKWSLRSNTPVIARTPPLGFEVSKKYKNNIMRISPQLNKKSNSPPSETSTSSETSDTDPALVSAFMNQVSELVRFVDLRDIVELELKQQGCEVVIKKKEATFL